jgi:hypothetical protein
MSRPWSRSSRHALSVLSLRLGPIPAALGHQGTPDARDRRENIRLDTRARYSPFGALQQGHPRPQPARNSGARRTRPPFGVAADEDLPISASVLSSQTPSAVRSPLIYQGPE